MTAVPGALAALAVLLGPASPAGAQAAAVYDSLTADDVRDLLILNGLRVITEPVDGEELVANDRVVVDDFARWHVYLYDCEGEACGDMEFRLAFSDATPTLEQLNAWNARYRFTRAYLSPGGHAVLAMDVNVSGGVTAASISEVLPVWRRSVARFANMLAAPDDD